MSNEKERGKEKYRFCVEGGKILCSGIRQNVLKFQKTGAFCGDVSLHVKLDSVEGRKHCVHQKEQGLSIGMKLMVGRDVRLETDRIKGHTMREHG